MDLICKKCGCSFISKGTRGPKPKYCPSCSNVYYKSTKKVLIINKFKYSWTKYGGRRHGLIKKKLDYWNCQSCGEEHSRDLPSYLFPFGEVDWVKICSNCDNIAFKHDLSVFVSLTALARTCKPFETLDTLVPVIK